MKITPEIAHEIHQLHSYHKWSKRRIARKIKVSEGTVRNVLGDVRRASARRTRTRNDAKITARRKVVSSIADEEVTKLVHGRKVRVGKAFPSLGEIAAEYERRSGGTVAPATVHRDLSACGFVSRARPRVVNNDPVKNKERFLFAKDMRRRKLLGRHIIFSDECWVNDNDNTNRAEWTRAGASPTPRRFQKRPGVKVMVWGAIGRDYKSPLVIIETNVTAKVYQDTMLPVVDTAMKRFRQRHFMQDGAKPHSATTTIRKLDSMKVKVIKWPAHSPHLNPIEKLWNIIHRRIAAKRPKDITELKRLAVEVWNSIPMSTINNLVDGFDDGVDRTIDNKGMPW